MSPPPPPPPAPPPSMNGNVPFRSGGFVSPVSSPSTSGEREHASSASSKTTMPGAIAKSLTRSVSSTTGQHPRSAPSTPRSLTRSYTFQGTSTKNMVVSSFPATRWLSLGKDEDGADVGRGGGGEGRIGVRGPVCGGGGGPRSIIRTASGKIERTAPIIVSRFEWTSSTDRSVPSLPELPAEHIANRKSRRRSMTIPSSPRVPPATPRLKEEMTITGATESSISAPGQDRRERQRGEGKEDRAREQGEKGRRERKERGGDETVPLSLSPSHSSSSSSPSSSVISSPSNPRRGRWGERLRGAGGGDGGRSGSSREIARLTSFSSTASGVSTRSDRRQGRRQRRNEEAGLLDGEEEDDEEGDEEEEEEEDDWEMDAAAASSDRAPTTGADEDGRHGNVSPSSCASSAAAKRRQSRSNVYANGQSGLGLAAALSSSPNDGNDVETNGQRLKSTVKGGRDVEKAGVKPTAKAGGGGSSLAKSDWREKESSSGGEVGGVFVSRCVAAIAVPSELRTEMEAQLASSSSTTSSSAGQTSMLTSTASSLSPAGNETIVSGNNENGRKSSIVATWSRSADADVSTEVDKREHRGGEETGWVKGSNHILRRCGSGGQSNGHMVSAAAAAAAAAAAEVAPASAIMNGAEGKKRDGGGDLTTSACASVQGVTGGVREGGVKKKDHKNEDEVVAEIGSRPPALSISPPSPPMSRGGGTTNMTVGIGDVGKRSPTTAAASPNKLASLKLNRWARARALRTPSWKAKTMEMTSAEKPPSPVVVEDNEPAQDEPSAGERSSSRLTDGGAESDDEGSGCDGPVVQKQIFIVSDATGWTAENAVHSALGQFESRLFDVCPVSTHLFSQVTEVDDLMEIVRQAAEEGNLLVFTLADPALREAAVQACEMFSVPYVDLLSPLLNAMALHLGISPSGIPRGVGRKQNLTKQYFKRIEAVEFTIRQDDGALPRNLQKSDIVLVGVSRTSKTPLSTYMAQKGYKVANVPLVVGIDPPKELWEVDQNKVFGLTINPQVLSSIRLARFNSFGLTPATSKEPPEGQGKRYSDRDYVRRELEYAHTLFSQNPKWPVIEVTGRAVEESAAIILRIFHERQNQHRMPRISWRY